MDAGGRDAGEGDAHLVYDSDYKTFTFVQTFAASGENAANLVWGLGIGQKRRFITQENSQKNDTRGYWLQSAPQKTRSTPNEASRTNFTFLL